MTEPIHFHTDLYRRDALELAAEKYQRQARIELADVRRPRRRPPASRWRGGDDGQALRDEFCNEAFSATARRLRATSAAAAPQEPRGPAGERAAVGAAGAVRAKARRSASAGCSSR